MSNTPAVINLFHNYLTIDAQNFLDRKQLLEISEKLYSLLQIDANLVLLVKEAYFLFKTTYPGLNINYFLIPYRQKNPDKDQLIANILSDINDSDFAVKILYPLIIEQAFNEKTFKQIKNNYLEKLVEKRLFWFHLLTSLEGSEIDLFLDFIEKYQIPLYPIKDFLHNNYQVTSYQLDRFAQIIKNNFPQKTKLDDLLYIPLLLHSNIDSVVIKNHLSHETLKNWVQTANSFHINRIKEFNCNKSEMDKFALVTTFPRLKNEIMLNALDISIETLS